METKQVVYVALVISAFLVGCLLPLRVLLGAPLSLIVLAFFGPKLNKRIIATIFSGLIMGNFVMDMPQWFVTYEFGRNYLLSIGFSEIFYAWGYIAALFIVFSLGHLYMYHMAGKLIKRSKLWQRYPLA